MVSRLRRFPVSSSSSPATAAAAAGSSTSSSSTYQHLNDGNDTTGGSVVANAAETDAPTTTKAKKAPQRRQAGKEQQRRSSWSPRRNLFFFKNKHQQRQRPEDEEESRCSDRPPMSETMQQTCVVPMISHRPPSAQADADAMSFAPLLDHDDDDDDSRHRGEREHEHDEDSVNRPATTTTTLCATAASSAFFQFCGIRQKVSIEEEEEQVFVETHQQDQQQQQQDEPRISSSSPSPRSRRPAQRGNRRPRPRRLTTEMPDDPTVEESIECVIAASQGELADLLRHYDQHEPVTPSALQQSMLKNRRNTSRVDNNNPHHRTSLSSLSRQSVPGDHAVPPTTACPTTATTTATSPLKIIPPNMATTAPGYQQKCKCCQTSLPQISPHEWPQRPLLLRPTPNSGTIVKGVRFVNDTEYLWTPRDDADTSATTVNDDHDDDHDGDNNDSLARSRYGSWMEALDARWGLVNGNDVDARTTIQPTHYCPQCVALPINGGDELPGQTLVTDFESDLFVGTLLLRIRNSHGTVREEEEHRLSDQGYFYGLNRRYQVVIRGKFKTTIPWTECLTGFQLERPAGKLPPKWIVNGALNVIKFFAPQLQTNMLGDRPYSLTPLGSTPQVLAVNISAGMEPMQEEPTVDDQTLLGHASTAKSSMQRARLRKKNFDKIYATTVMADDEKAQHTLVTDPTKEYTFEFLQHLFNFDDFSIELGPVIGSVSLQSILAGQALQIMASHGQPNKLDDDPTSTVRNRLWSFDIWHEMLLSSSWEPPKQ